MLTIEYQNQFKRDYRLMMKRGYKKELLKEIVDTLQCEVSLPQRNCDHKLIGNYADCRECHIQSDWLLIYQVDSENKVLKLMRTGTHSDLFGK